MIPRLQFISLVISISASFLLSMPNINNAFRFEVREEGNGIYYTPYSKISNNIFLVYELGVYSSKLINKNFNRLYNYNLSFTPGVRKKMFKYDIYGLFNPVLMSHIGISSNLMMLDDINFIHNLGIGFQFHNLKVINELLFNINFLDLMGNNESVLSFSISIYNK